jgi:hypothetical protein
LISLIVLAHIFVIDMYDVQLTLSHECSCPAIVTLSLSGLQSFRAPFLYQNP